MLFARSTASYAVPDALCSWTKTSTTRLTPGTSNIASAAQRTGSGIDRTFVLQMRGAGGAFDIGKRRQPCNRLYGLGRRSHSYVLDLVGFRYFSLPQQRD